MSIAMDVPVGTVAVVLFEHGDNGQLLARYAEGQERVPAPRRQVIDALLRLAVHDGVAVGKFVSNGSSNG